MAQVHNFNVESLSDYTKENRLPLLAKSILGAHTMEHVTLQGDCRGNAVALNLIETTAPFQDGSQCGWSASGDTKLSQRLIHPQMIKVNMEYCDKELAKKWASYEVQISALPEDKRFPFESYVMDGIADSIKGQIEKLLWQGDSDNTAEWDGFIKNIEDSNEANEVTVATGSTVYGAIKDVYLATPEAVADKDDYEIYVAPSIFREFIQELVAANLFHFNPNDDRRTYLLPGTNVPVVALEGLEGTKYIIAARKSNLFVGVDMASDSTDIAAWYSLDNRQHRVACEFVMGTQVAFPDEITYAKLGDNNGSGTGGGNNSGTQGSQGSQG